MRPEKNLKNSKFGEISPGSFFYSMVYPVFTGLLALLLWISDMQLVGIFLASLAGGYILAFKKDVFPIIPLLFSVILIFRNLSVFSQPATYLLFAPTVVGIIVHLIRFRPAKPVSLKLALPIAAVGAAMFSGGLFSPYAEYYASGIMFIVTLSIAILAEYAFLSLYFNAADGFRYKKFICVQFICTAAVAGLQFVFITNGTYIGEPFGHKNFGWGNYNYAGYLALFAVPACYYLIATAKNPPLLFPVLILLYVLPVAVGSDGAFGIVIVFTPFCFYFTFRLLRQKDKLAFLGLLLFATLCLTAAIIVFNNRFSEIVEFVKYHFLYDTGRTKLYKDAWEIFKSYPVFGAGLGYAATVIKEGQNFHSVVFHTLATMGLVGLAAYIYYYWVRIKILFGFNTPFNLFMFVAFAMFTAYSSIDCGEFNILMVFATMIIVVTEYSNKNQEMGLPLPALKSRFDSF